jgi:hypothetical protein
MKSKTGKKTDSDKATGSTGKGITGAARPVIEEAGEKNAADDELTKDEVSGLEEALKNSDIGKPITLKEFKKMAKKWGSK